MIPSDGDGHALSHAAYVHIPFCRSVCSYCAFAVVSGRDDEIDRYVDAVVAEITADEPWQTFDSVYFGGGTPSHVDPSRLGRILEALDERHGIAADAEISIEANPEDFDRDLAIDLRGLGFNRVSFGAQSLDSATLRSLGRAHRPGDVVDAVAHARDVGFDNLSLDLIFGVDCETDESWEESLRAALALGPDHVSCYALTVEPGTALSRAIDAGAPGPDDDVQAGRYETADALLADAGMERYEVSNWSRPGWECRYNLIVWAQGQYAGYGMGAHGFRSGARYKNHRSLGAYIRRVEAAVAPRAGVDGPMDAWEAELDRIFVGLRRAAGVGIGPGTEALLQSEQGRRLVELGVVVADGHRVRVTKPLLMDAVHRSVVTLSRPNVSTDGNARRS